MENSVFRLIIENPVFRLSTYLSKTRYLDYSKSALSNLKMSVMELENKSKSPVFHTGTPGI